MTHEVRQRAEAAIARAMARRDQPGYGFVDEIPESPLKVARYERDYALELVGGTGWEVVALHPPGALHPALHGLPSRLRRSRDVSAWAGQPGRSRRRTWRSCDRR